MGMAGMRRWGVRLGAPPPPPACRAPTAAATASCRCLQLQRTPIAAAPLQPSAPPHLPGAEPGQQARLLHKAQLLPRERSVPGGGRRHERRQHQQARLQRLPVARKHLGRRAGQRRRDGLCGGRAGGQGRAGEAAGVGSRPGSRRQREHGRQAATERAPRPMQAAQTNTERCRAGRCTEVASSLAHCCCCTAATHFCYTLRYCCTALTRLHHVHAVARLDAAHIRDEPLKVAVARCCTHQLAEGGLQGGAASGRRRRRAGAIQAEQSGEGGGSRRRRVHSTGGNLQQAAPMGPAWRTSPEAASSR